MFVTALFVVPLLVVSSTADGQRVYIYPNHVAGRPYGTLKLKKTKI